MTAYDFQSRKSCVLPYTHTVQGAYTRREREIEKEKTRERNILLHNHATWTDL